MENIEKIRHSLSHLMSMAILEKYPKASLGMGPSIENGFYQDYDFGKAGISEKDFEWIEKKMREMIAQKIKFIKGESTFAAALKFYKHDPLKTEIIKDLKKSGEKKLNFYDSDWFHNLCAGPHVKDTSVIDPNAFKITRIAGAYWKGNEKNKMLTRIYGVAFETKKELDDFLVRQAEAEKRDHRILGQKLDLFTFSDLVGKGLPLFTEKGAAIRRELERFIIDEEIKRDYKHVYTPDLAKVDLYKKSGHYPYYKDTMYPVMKIDEEELILRPMTCPHHYELYLQKQHSYRELPYRIAELAKQFRYEKSGELTGLMRVRQFCLADAHIIVQKEGVSAELENVLDLIEYVASVFQLEKGKDYRYRLSLGDRKNSKKYYKDDKAWDFAENVLRTLLKKRNAPFFEAENEAAFYGPKIDIQMKNFSGKEDTAFTVQYDFVGPKRFELNYVDADGAKKEAVVIHRSSIGCIERIMAFLIEKYEGTFPLWLSPVQVAIITVSEKHEEYGKKIENELKNNNIRYETWYQNESVGKKIREAEMQKIPYILVIGDKEIAASSVAVRERRKGDTGMVQLSNFIQKVKEEIKDKK